LQTFLNFPVLPYRMGVKMPGILPVRTITWEELRGKKIGVDFSNCAYQFLSSIRQPDGTPLMDSKGNITSHLQGLFSRTLNLINKGIKICYIFDGRPPLLKQYEREEREHRKRVAEERLQKAMDEEDIESMGKYSKQTARLTSQMVSEAKELVKAMGLPVIQSPQESDAQGAFMTERDDLFAFATSDADSLMHGCPRTIVNLTLAEKRKIPGGNFVYIKPQLIELKDVLKHLKINQDQLIVMGILTGTDYNPKGVYGIGPKKALNLVQQYKKFDKLFSEIDTDFDWKQIYAIFKSMAVMKNYQLKWQELDEESVLRILVDKHEFSEERVKRLLEKNKQEKENKKQKSLNEF